MAKDREDRKKEKKEKKERKRREAEELAKREKKSSKKNKSKSKVPEKKKPKKKLKKPEAVQEKPHKKSNKKHKKPSEDEPATVTDPVKIRITTATNESDSDSDDFDKEDFKNLLETHTKEELINLIHKTAEKNSRLVAAVLESAELDSSKRNIFVRGLGWDTTHETLKSAFETYGEIEDCSVVMDKDTGRAKGYGFVMFKTRKGCREALRNPEKRMFNRTVSCNLAAAKPVGVGKGREPVVESVKIDLSQSEVVLPPLGMDLGFGLDKGQKQQNVVPGMYGGQNMPFYGHGGYNPMYAAAAFMGNQMGPAGVPNFPMFGPGMMNHGPPNHMGMAGQYGGEGNGGVGPGFDAERAWYLR